MPAPSDDSIPVPDEIPLVKIPNPPNPVTFEPNAAGTWTADVPGEPVERGGPIAVVHHGAINEVLGWDPPRLGMRTRNWQGYKRDTFYEIAFDDRDTPVVYVDTDGDEYAWTAGRLVDHLLDLQETRARADAAGARPEWLRDPSKLDASSRTTEDGWELHRSHTTVPAPSTVTTADGRIRVDDWDAVRVSLYDHDGRQFNGSGGFLVRAHGFDYEGHRPVAMWLELVPITPADGPDDGWLEQHPRPPAENVEHSTEPAPAGWANTPGGTDREKADARAAIALLRKLIEDQMLIMSPAVGGWGWLNPHGDYERVEPPEARRLLDELAGRWGWSDAGSGE